MKETEALLRLQEIDLELMRHKATLAEMPQAKKVAAVKAAKRKLAQDYKRLFGQLKDCRMELEENEAKQRDCEEKIERVKAEYSSGDAGFRAARDAEAHLTALAKGHEKLVYRHGELAKEQERLERAERNARDLDARLTEEGKAQIASYQEETRELHETIEGLGQEREHCLRNMTEDVRKRYAAASERFGGLAVERLRGNVPSVCRVKLQPAAYSDLVHGPAVTECPYCHRLLVTEGALDDVD